MKSSFIILLLAFITSFGWGQDFKEIEGRILNASTGQPVSYANVYNKTQDKGTISNDDGYFRILTQAKTDSILIIFIGYELQTIALTKDKEFYTIHLEESTQLLREIVVTPNDNVYLFDLLVKCKSKASSSRTEAKAYYELKTYRNDRQIELVEGYYNATIAGYELSGLRHKAGRLALHPYENRLFASMESSAAIIAMKLLNNNSNFPDSPFELTKNQMRKNFALSLEKKYIDSNADSIYVISYEPADTSGLFFNGTIWINKTTFAILKISLNSRVCRKHPFRPIFPMDTISKVSFAITKTFSPQGKQMAFHHIDFTYTIDYKSKKGEDYAQNYTITSNAILYAYDFTNTFFIPPFEVTDNVFSDYRKINAMPYNDFFWQYNDEYKLKDDDNSNELFFNDLNSFTNKTIFKSFSIPLMKYRTFQHPYVTWDEDRVFFREFVADTSSASPSSDVMADKYHLGVKIFVDINTYQDSTSIFTATVFDPYTSFYHLPIDNRTHCFINMYFDLCEIERRRFDALLKSSMQDTQQFGEIYRKFEIELQHQQDQYLRSVDRGTKEPEMVKWNSYIVEHLGINNIGLFKPFDEKN